jgi:hypothetical protein
MEITRNTKGTYSLFLPMHYERMGKYGFRVRFVGYVSDGDFNMALEGLADDRHRRQFTVTATGHARGHEWAQ